MDWFHSTHVNKIDKKGRVSVPADFRAVLARRGGPSLVLFPAIHYQAIEGSASDYLKEINDKIEQLPPFSQERDDLIDAILPAIIVLNPDSEGRISLPEHLIEHAGLTDTAVFLGRSRNFHIVNQLEMKRRQDSARDRQRTLRQPGGGQR